MHRGYEKLAEVRTYAQITALVNRIDWVSGFASEVPFISAVEKLTGIEAPERAQWIRLILTELFRISSTSCSPPPIRSSSERRRRSSRPSENASALWNSSRR